MRFSRLLAVGLVGQHGADHPVSLHDGGFGQLTSPSVLPHSTAMPVTP